LRNGGPTGSAMPLVWAHAEYVKLLRSLRDGTVYDCPPQTHARYVVQHNMPRVTAWSFSHQSPRLVRGRVLRVDLKAPARVRWSHDEWATYEEHDTHERAHGLHTVDLPTRDLREGSRVLFTFQWLESMHWEGRDFATTVVP
jgi:glucoamylase